MSHRRCIVCDGEGPFALLFQQGPYRMVRCPRCRLVFQDPQPGDDVLAGSYYHDAEFTKALLGPLREITLARAREKLPLLRRVGALRPGMRMLDVGCSSGAWLEVGAAEGLRGTGVEIGEATSQAARQRGLEVLTGTLADVAPALSERRFDLITFWDVLEHLPDPRRELRLAADLLAPNGLVAATFPNVEGLYPRLTYRLFARRAGVWEYPELPVHLYDFSPATASRLLDNEGYDTAAVVTFATPFEFYRETTLSPERLGPGRRSLALRLGFDALRRAVYPLAALCRRGNAMFAAGRLRSRG
ncbi:MAG: class I SAM-dependent methyltransferase [Thermoleophilaceae bacterium]